MSIDRLIAGATLLVSIVIHAAVVTLQVPPSEAQTDPRAAVVTVTLSQAPVQTTTSSVVPTLRDPPELTPGPITEEYEEPPKPLTEIEPPQAAISPEISQEQVDDVDGSERGTNGPEPVSSPPASHSPELLNRYQNEVRSRIENARVYPIVARRREQEGRVIVRFSLAPSGAIVDGPFVQSASRYERLNQAALEAVRGGAPFPAFDSKVGTDELTFLVPINFTLVD